MSKTTTSVGMSAQRYLGFRGMAKWPMTSPTSIAGAFLVALVLAAVVLAIFGAGERGTAIALRATARWSFLLFWFAYVGSATAKLFGSRFDGLARHGRDLGLAYAAAQLIHVGLVGWLLYLTDGSGGTMLVFWAGIACTYLLALFSWPRLRAVLGPTLWRVLRTVTMDFIAYVFAVDFIIIPLQASGHKYPLSYVPFAVMLLGGVGLRIAAWPQSKAIGRPLIS